MKETKLSETHIYKGTLLDVWRDEVRLPDDRTSIREYIKHPGAVVILPVLPDNKIVFIRQFRYSVGKEFIELPAGKLDPGENRKDSARRELKEETGYRAEKWTELTEIHPCIGYSDESIWLFLAEDLTASQQQMDHDEFIEIIPTTLDDAVEMVKSGEITDAKTIVGILWANSYLQHLLKYRR